MSRNSLWSLIPLQEIDLLGSMSRKRQSRPSASLPMHTRALFNGAHLHIQLGPMEPPILVSASPHSAFHTDTRATCAYTSMVQRGTRTSPRRLRDVSSMSGTT